MLIEIICFICKIHFYIRPPFCYQVETELHNHTMRLFRECKIDDNSLRWNMTEQGASAIINACPINAF